MVLAPEHPLVHGLEKKIENWDEVHRYVAAAQKKTEIERTAEDKDPAVGEAGKTGGEPAGGKGSKPRHKEKNPIFVVD